MGKCRGNGNIKQEWASCVQDLARPLVLPLEKLKERPVEVHE